MSTARASLEDIFMELTSGQSQQAGSIAETEVEEEEAREA